MIRYEQEDLLRTPSVSRQALVEQYEQVRSFSEHLCETLVTEDYTIQSMADVSPTKWHLAHVTWFWETFLLAPAKPDYQSLHPQYAYLFNSYYNTLGTRHCRPKRGLISRPTVEETYRYRAYVDEHVLNLLTMIDDAILAKFIPEPALHFLQQIARTCKGGGLLIGVDLKKDLHILHRAYNDQQGITARFNKNLLTRINRELEANFQLDQFGHYAFYNPLKSRIEMHLVSLKDQAVTLGDSDISFQLGESIWTESSYKYTLGEFAQLAAKAGFRVERVWTDEQKLFSIQYLMAI